MVLAQAHKKPITTQFLDMQIWVFEWKGNDRCIDGSCQNLFGKVGRIAMGRSNGGRWQDRLMYRTERTE